MLDVVASRRGFGLGAGGGAAFGTRTGSGAGAGAGAGGAGAGAAATTSFFFLLALRPRCAFFLGLLGASSTYQAAAGSATIAAALARVSIGTAAIDAAFAQCSAAHRCNAMGAVRTGFWRAVAPRAGRWRL